MMRLLVDATLPAKLATLTERAELCDETGQVLGHFIPRSDYPDYGPREPQVSEEELDRRSRSNERTYTTAEVIAHLAKL